MSSGLNIEVDDAYEASSSRCSRSGLQQPVVVGRSRRLAAGIIQNASFSSAITVRCGNG